jgi:hypothetical protein
VDRIASSAAPDFVILLPILGRLFEFPGNTQKLHNQSTISIHFLKEQGKLSRLLKGCWFVLHFLCKSSWFVSHLVYKMTKEGIGH